MAMEPKADTTSSFVDLLQSSTARTLYGCEGEVEKRVLRSLAELLALLFAAYFGPPLVKIMPRESQLPQPR